MKIIPILLITALISFSCSKKTDTITLTTKPEINKTTKTEVPFVPIVNSDNQGLKLIEGADCLACHKIDSKLIGPSYQDVAAKYTEADIETLAQKIIDGGKGNWGDIPMTAHAGLNKDDAKLMVKYILSLKK